MKQDEFVKHVQAFAQLDSREDTQRAIQATLETLGSRIYGNEAKDLASQLPQEIAQYLQGHEGESGESFSLKDFYERVAQKEGVDGATASIHTKAVFAVLAEAVTPGEFSDIRANLSDDYEELFAVNRAT
jgi:uncharacterized protein (DUF2267 family)